jgi:hypothetical protein
LLQFLESERERLIKWAGWPLISAGVYRIVTEREVDYCGGGDGGGGGGGG